MARRIPVVNGKKKCKDCGELLPIDSFSERIKEGRSTRRSECKKCSIDYLNQWRAKNPDANSFWYRRKLGVNREVFDRMLSDQGGKCAICGTVPARKFRGDTFHVDHDHATGAVRGLLCGLCNKLLGCAKDSLEILEASKRYLADRKER